MCMASGYAAGSFGPIVTRSSVDLFEKHLLKKSTLDGVVGTDGPRFSSRQR